MVSSWIANSLGDSEASTWKIIFPHFLLEIIYGSKGCIKGNSVILDDGTTTKVNDIFEKKASKEEKEKFFPMGIKDSFSLSRSTNIILFEEDLSNKDCYCTSII